MTSTPKLASDNVDSSQDEDADILRAVLLASMSKKITRKPLTAPVTGARKRSDERVLPFPRTQSALVHPLKLNRQLIKNLPKLPSSSITVKPLIINLGDSDSDSQAPAMATEQEIIKNNVAAFLKQQRAAVEKAAEKTESLALNKSALKLLPKSQQLEYRKLKQKLLNAAKKKIFQKTDVATVPHVVCDELKVNKTPQRKPNNSGSLRQRYSLVNKPDKVTINKSTSPNQNMFVNRPLSSEKSVTTSDSKVTMTDTDNSHTSNSVVINNEDSRKKKLYQIISTLRKILTDLQVNGKPKKNGRYYLEIGTGKMFYDILKIFILR